MNICCDMFSLLDKVLYSAISGLEERGHPQWVDNGELLLQAEVREVVAVVQFPAGFGTKQTPARPAPLARSGTFLFVELANRRRSGMVVIENRHADEIVTGRVSQSSTSLQVKRTDSGLWAIVAVSDTCVVGLSDQRMLGATVHTAGITDGGPCAKEEQCRERLEHG